MNPIKRPADVATAGAPPSPAEIKAIHEAASWYARLCSGDATAADRRRWEAWRCAQPVNGSAWDRVETMQRRMNAVPASVAAPALSAAALAGASRRRAVLRAVSLTLGGGALGWWGWRQPLRHELLADLRTSIGEQREVSLADGSQLTMNTGTAVDLAFSASSRLLMLRAGEILIQTAVDPELAAGRAARPFLVDTAHGRIRALGTRFLVRTDEDLTRVIVLAHAVEVRATATGTSGAPTVVRTGQQFGFGPAGIDGKLTLADAAAEAWRQGSLIAADMPLSRFLAELGRYRSGMLSCDPSIAGLRVSGAFPVPDTDRALRVLAAGLPVRVESRTRYWVRVVPR